MTDIKGVFQKASMYDAYEDMIWQIIKVYQLHPNDIEYCGHTVKHLLKKNGLLNLSEKEAENNE